MLTTARSTFSLMQSVQAELMNQHAEVRDLLNWKAKVEQFFKTLHPTEADIFNRTSPRPTANRIADPLSPPSPIPPYTPVLVQTSVEELTANGRHEPSTDEEEEGNAVELGATRIPQNHTTSANQLLLWPQIAEMTKGLVNHHNYVTRQEEKRGIIHVWGRGEGLDVQPSATKDFTPDRCMAPYAADDASPDGPSPASGAVQTGSFGGPSPGAGRDAMQRSPEDRFNLLNADFSILPDEETVWRLFRSYMENINNLHPILSKRNVESAIRAFYRESYANSFVREVSTPATRGPTVGFLGSGSSQDMQRPPAKRKYEQSPVLSNAGAGGTQTQRMFKPDRSIRTALVLLVLALGRICEHRGRIPDLIDDPEQAQGTAHGRPGRVNSSSTPGSPSFPPPGAGRSPVDEPSPQSRRPSIENGNGIGNGIDVPGAARPTARNLDVIPGLAYFAVATDILGNQQGGVSLTHVHACLLAGLYQGQLGRVLESLSYIVKGNLVLQQILRPKAEKLTRLAQEFKACHPKDNALMFSFWTGLQLEADIVAEFPDQPQSGVLRYEEQMPHPDIVAALSMQADDGITERILQNYMAQLQLRKHLNDIHSYNYKPNAPGEFLPCPSLFSRCFPCSSLLCSLALSVCLVQLQNAVPLEGSRSSS